MRRRLPPDWLRPHFPTPSLTITGLVVVRPPTAALVLHGAAGVGSNCGTACCGVEAPDEEKCRSRTTGRAVPTTRRRRAEIGP